LCAQVGSYESQKGEYSLRNLRKNSLFKVNNLVCFTISYL